MRTKTILITTCFTVLFSFFSASKNEVQWTREGKGKDGYDRVNQTYNGTVNGNPNYSVVCQNPGFERCRFIPPTSTPPSGGININLDDIADYYGSPFMNDFAELAELKIEDDLELSGFFDKTIQFTLNEIEYRVYITLSWEVLGDGSVVMQGTTEAFLI